MREGGGGHERRTCSLKVGGWVGGGMGVEGHAKRTCSTNSCVSMLWKGIAPSSTCCSHTNVSDQYDMIQISLPTFSIGH